MIVLQHGRRALGLTMKTRWARDPLEKEANMNSISTNIQTPTTLKKNGEGTDIMAKLPWSLAFAAIPFIPDFLETLRSIPDQIARNGYALHVKHGQTEFHFNRAEIVGDVVKGGSDDEQDM